MNNTILEKFIELDKNTEIPRANKKLRFLYLIYNRYTKLTKVGVTDNINNRLNQLTNQNGVDLDLVMFIECAEEIDVNVKWLEEFIHSHFNAKRQKGEWFNFDIRDAVSVRSLLWHVHGDYIEDNMLELLKTV